MGKNIDLKILDETIESIKNNDKSNLLVGDSQQSNEVFTIAQSNPNNQLRKFLGYLYEQELADLDCFENIKLCENKNVADLTIEEVLTKLTFIIRGDRFNSGYLAVNIEDGTILLLLERLKALCSNK